MLSIREIYGLKSRTDGVGIEVEVEAKTPLPDEIGGVWLAKDDHSLRDYHYEYVCRQPIKVGPDKINHIRVLTDKLNRPEITLSMSSRTSVHVHRNIQEFTPVQLWTAIIAYWMIEEPLLNYCGKHRKANLFCLPLSRCEGIIHQAVSDMEFSRPFSTFNQTTCKYGGQNLATIQKYGSLEYRSMQGTTDPEIIDKWSTGLYELGERSKQFKDPSVLMDYYLDSSKDILLNALLPKDFCDIIKSCPDYEGLIRENVIRLCDLAYIHDDWEAWGNKFEKAVERKTSKQAIEDLLGVAGEAPTTWAIPDVSPAIIDD